LGPRGVRIKGGYRASNEDRDLQRKQHQQEANNLVDWLGTARPDVACLQELKATDSEVPFAAIKQSGYGGVWRGEKSWNGVAILARRIEPIVTNNALPGDPSDAQGRYIEAAVGGVLIASLYAPNGNPQPGPKFTYKLAWDGAASGARSRAL
jgi:exodeoxyribonuclease III